MSGKRIHRLAAAAALAAAAGFVSAPAGAVEIFDPPSQEWAFEGIFGTYDRAVMQRGYQVYVEVCSGCHSLDLLYFRNLGEIGFSEDQVKAIAAEYEVEDGPNDEGEMYLRPGLTSDAFVAPYANDKAARYANEGALPPDLSVITKARHDGANYLYALLAGYKDEVPEGVVLTEGVFYNEYFPGHLFSMAPVIEDELVEYGDGTKATAEQITRDVVTFLAWASEPEMEARKSLGRYVMLYLIVLTAMLYALKRRIWSDVH